MLSMGPPFFYFSGKCLVTAIHLCFQWFHPSFTLVEMSAIGEEDAIETKG